MIRGATVYDGSGRPGTRADVAVHGDRIAAVGDVPAQGVVEIDARGLAVAPGFIDVHAHDDLAVLSDPGFACKVLQGVTTDIVGNCGMGVVPFEVALPRFAAWVEEQGQPTPFEGYAGYLQRVDEVGLGLNVAVLVGHGTARAAVMGHERRPATRGEVGAMAKIVEEGAAAGAVGLSTGLIYEPGRYAETDEIVELAQVMHAAGGLYATHMRNEASGLLDSVREAIAIGERAGIRVQVSHHKASGRENWGAVKRSLALIEQARSTGLDVTCDQYPYISGSTGLFAVVQNNAFNDRYAEGGIGRIEPQQVLIASCPAEPSWEGRTLEDLCRELDLPAEEAAKRVLRVERGTVVVLEMMCEEDVETVLRHPTTMIGSDGIPAGSKPHPRLFGTFPRVLGRYVRDRGVIDLPTAIHRMTGMPAAKFRLEGRGLVREGAFADLVVFDPATISDTATFADPQRTPEGVAAVVVNGEIVARDGRLTGRRPGRGLRRGTAWTPGEA